MDENWGYFYFRKPQFWVARKKFRRLLLFWEAEGSTIPLETVKPFQAVKGFIKIGIEDVFGSC